MGSKAVMGASWLRDGGGVLFLALATLGFFWRVVSGQNWMPADGGDLVSFLYPTYRWAAETLQQGVWPLWNPVLYGGAPHVGDVQAGFLYPPNLVLFLLWPRFSYQALQWLSMGHIWFAGAGMYLLLARGHRCGRLPALAGALAFMFSDAFIVHFGNLNFIAAASWLPWIVWAFGSGLRHLASRPGWTFALFWRVALSGVLLALATLAGHIQVTLFILLALTIYTFAWLWLNREGEGAARRIVCALGALALVTAVTVMIAAPVFLPSLELSRYTQRVDWDYTSTAGYSLSPVQLIGWLIPGFFGRGPQFHWGAWPRVESGYLGVLPLILALAALLYRRDRATWIWLAVAVSSLVLALGIYAIPHGWLSLLPGFSLLRAPARLVLLTDFAVAALAASGLRALLDPLRDPAARNLSSLWRLVRWATGATLLVGVPLSYLSILLTQDRDPAIVLRVSISAIAVVTFAVVLSACALWLKALLGAWAQARTLACLAIALIFVDVASLGAYQDLGDRDPSGSFEQPAIVAFLAAQSGPFRIDAQTGIDDLWQPDTALLHGLEDVGGLANPLRLADGARFWESLGSRSSPLYDLLNTRFVIAKKDVTLDWSKFALVFADDPQLNVYLNSQALPRAFVVSESSMVGSHEAAWTAIHAPDFDPARSVVVESALRLAGEPGGGSAETVRTGPGLLEVSVHGTGTAWLVVSQSWYPGWHVSIDGVDAGTPVRADYAFQAVALPGGEHRVVLSYQPALWRIGWLLAGGAVALLAAVTLAWRRGWRSGPRGLDLSATQMGQPPEETDYAV